MTESDTLAAGAEVAAPQTTAVRPGFPLYLVIFALMLGIDQASKAWARAEFRPSERLALWPNVFELTLTYNEGIAFVSSNPVAQISQDVVQIANALAAHLRERSPAVARR